MSNGAADTVALASQHTGLRNLAWALVIAAPVILFVFTHYLPYTVDWYDNFGLAVHVPLAPYQVPAYLSPPWFALILSPLGLFPSRLGQAINAYLNLAVAALVIARFRGGRWSFVLTFTSLPFAALILNGNVEWIPMLAMLLPRPWGLPLLAAKPQAGGLVGLIWLKQARDKVRLLLPLAVVVSLSFVVWGWWPGRILANFAARPAEIGEDHSPWPWLVPVGLAALYQAWKKEDELAAIGATLCLSPYYIVHSVTLFFAMLSARTPRRAAVFSALLWMWVVWKNWHLLFPSP